MPLNTILQPSRSFFRCLQTVTSRCLQPASAFHSTAVRSDSNRTCVVRLGRQKYERLYPVLLVRPDGSTINIRYKEPRRIMMMPVDISSLSDEERKARMRRREPRRAAVRHQQDEFEDDFKVDDYSQFWRRK